MKVLKNKFLISIITIIITMFIVPFGIFNNVDNLSAVGWILIFLFLINPIISIGLGIYNGLEFRKICFMPLIIFIAFPLLYWIILQEIIFDFSIILASSSANDVVVIII